MKILKSAQFMALIPLPLISLLGLDDINLVTPQPDTVVVAEREMSLENRQPNSWVNEVFKDNILLNLAYLRNIEHSKQPNWDEVKQDFSYEFSIEPGQTFAFHDDVYEKYQPNLVKTTNAHFNATEGFRSSGYLYGDGVCHLASLIYWVAKEAGLETEVPTNHNFANIPDVPREYGVSIYNNPFTKGSNARQNLYITNNKDKPIAFKFEYQNDKVKISIMEQN
ncbi:MAG: VanW family protein [Candidatus Daviesbacteria bacterium]|nr:VanW family protein [Candidatus Daviesbacteria bacterium]